MRRILLVEPDYRNKYPPLGLMKISSYHKLMGDFVKFVKGYDRSSKVLQWDRIYISTLFTFYWKSTVEVIEYYHSSVSNPSGIFLGGVMATLLKEEISKAFPCITIISGLLNRPGILDNDNRYIVDNLIPDYALLKETQYKYGLDDAYIGYATRGCPNHCQFCAVHILEPHFNDYVCLKKQILGAEEIYGPRAHLVLLDNNVLASKNFNQIMNDILELGFYKGAKYNNRLRKLDFNQGLDARLLTKEKMQLLSLTAIKPLRIAFDFIEMKNLYIDRVKLARDHGVLNLSNYVLFNFKDTPEDFYERLRINVLMNEELGTKIYSFPMKYIPLDAKNRTHIGRHWNKKLLRGIQCILLATKGKVSPRREFFEAAFGTSKEEFMKIAAMPDEYIIYRRHYENNGARDWGMLYDKLNMSQRETLLNMVSTKPHDEAIISRVPSSRLRKLLMHYVECQRKTNERRKNPIVANNTT